MFPKVWCRLNSAVIAAASTSTPKPPVTARFLNYTAFEYDRNQKNPMRFFQAADVQAILRFLTTKNYAKIFRRRRLETPTLRNPVYKFMTDRELAEARAKADSRAEKLLRMPPVMCVRDRIDEVVQDDPALKGFDTCDLLIIDTSLSRNDLTRTILVRDANGCLKTADWDTRARMNQIFFPRPGRQLHTPQLFADDQYFELALSNRHYEFVLDRACAQFEPDDPLYQRIVSITYQFVNDARHFDALDSTRHFGPMCFFFAWFEMVDNLLVHFIQNDKISESNALLTLLDSLKANRTEIDRAEWENCKDLTKIEQFLAKKMPDSDKRNEIEMAVQSYEERLAKEQQLDEGLKTAHGFQ